MTCMGCKIDTIGINKKQTGFTFIEVIIAIAIFAIVALGANAIFVEIFERSKLVDERSQELESLQRTMLIMERDFLQMQERIPRTQGLENQLVINGGEFELDSDAYAIGFVRGGWQNPQLRLKRSNLQNVAYRVQENRLERLHTIYVDSVIGTEPKVRVLLEQVSDFKIEVLQTVKEEFEWEETVENTTLPAAIAVTITTENFGEIRRVFKVRA
ncbi:type II secretion system minor pseudopilin GspJ [Glaciecola petra]|uniref:Type II secretion system protein J n=1 Tax=Glaciecola petra TaxID=3075602 RepID=A0ABU2ZRE2_9ALTE|nr:type II secretion system minor pseudopilin GspJ [Aestuariibacter sp. P117]MDT0595200.1 type II secretion system minor pseudopilin GspJ [Aestuariibacter sp. P117]